jgi:hypothetical protein
LAGWWEAPGRGTYWVEIRKVEGIGVELYCNARNRVGGIDARYELVRQVKAGDVIYHYNADESRFVGRSVAASDAVITPAEYRVPLAGFEAFEDVVGLAAIRAAADDLYQIRDELLEEYGSPLHLPFQFMDDPGQLRMMSNYFERLPEEMIEVLFGPLETSEALESGDEALEAARRVGGFLRPFKAKRDTDYLAHVEGTSATRERRHETLVNDCAAWLVGRGLEVGRNAAIDLGVVTPSIIIEAKTVGHVWSVPIRQAVSQLYEYRYFEVVPPDTELLLLIEEPVPDEWLAYLEQDRGIGAFWPIAGGYAGSPIAAKALGL